MLYLHGARWDVLSSSFRMRRLHALGVSVLGVDYRGFGRSSEALPSEAMAYEDARAAWEWLRAAPSDAAAADLRPFAGQRHRGAPRLRGSTTRPA